MGIMIEDKIVMRRINEIRPYVRNPRKNEKTVELLCKIIPRVGFNVPIVVDERGVIVKGHARFTAAIRLGMEEVPCIITHADEDAIKADRITDNKISEFSEWINEEVMHEIDSINLDFDFSELGFPTVKFDDMPSVLDLGGNTELSPEERKGLYDEFLARQQENSAVESGTVSEGDIKAAMERQKKEASVPKYYKCVCEKCGHVMFVKATDIAKDVS